MTEPFQPTDLSNCCGCEACVASCPAHCIKMVQLNGFHYPSIDASLCLQCNRCRQVCPQNAQRTTPSSRSRNIYGGYAADSELLMKASSGGIFPLLCQEIFKRCGTVFGAALDASGHILQHSRFTSLNECRAAFGSKYIQSRMGDSYIQVREDLQAGKWVLFCGTPCQLAALDNFLGNTPRERLLAVDVICHGVPSPVIWKEYLDIMEAKHEGKCRAVSFREKSGGWENYSLSLDFDKGEGLCEPHKKNHYMQLFLKSICLRESCHECHIRSMVHPADITLGDFWGVRKRYPEKYNSKGTSIIITHTPKGDDFLESLGKGLVRWKTDWDFCAKRNAALLESPRRPLMQKAFWEDWKECGLAAIMPWYGRSLAWHEKALCLFSFCTKLRRKAISRFLKKH